MKRAACIWLPQWPLQRLAAARAELRSRAVVLYQRHAGRGARVVAYCPRLDRATATSWEQEIKEAGGRRREEGEDKASPRGSVIRPGMPLAEATALAAPAGDDAGRLHLELHDPPADRLELAALAEWCQRFSPSVGWEEGDWEPGGWPESLLLDTSGLGPVFGGEPALAERVVREFQARGLTARVAIADTLGAAWAVAHFANREAGGAVVRMPLVVPPGRTWEAIAPLDVAALRLPPETCSLLADLGLRRIEQVAALARSTLLARFGPLVLARLDQASGAAAEAIVAQALPAERQFEWLFEHPTDRRDMIDAALAQLIARACQALAREGRGLLRLRCRLESERGPAEPFVVGLYRPSADQRHVAELARLQLESARARQPVTAIRLTVLAEDRLEYRQQEIFSDEHSAGEAPRALATLVDRLSNRLGAQAVLRPWLLAGAQPEFACQYQPLSSLAARRNRGKRRAARRKKNRGQDQAVDVAPEVPGDRPLCLRPRPLRVLVVSIAPAGPPARFRHAGRDHRVVRFWGPERIETGWWRTRCVRRDYYQVETGGGERFWLFRELTGGQWFLHGEFA